MTDEELKKIIPITLVANFDKPELTNAFVAEFPIFKSFVATHSPTNMTWRMRFNKEIRAREELVLTWFKEFTKNSHILDKHINSYHKLIKDRLEENTTLVVKSEGRVVSMISKGPPLWKKLHTYAAKWTGSKEALTKFLETFEKELSCGECRNHWKNLVAEFPPETISRDALFAWTVDMHNKVNVRLDKPEMSLTEAKTIYHYVTSTYFDRVYAINLDHHRGRWENLVSKLKEADWPFAVPVRFRAIDGTKLPMPNGWNHSAATWGRLQSHRQILEQCIMDGVDRVLIIEDDIIFSDNFASKAVQFVTGLPNNWSQLIFNDLGSGLKAYAVQGEYLKKMYTQLSAGFGDPTDIVEQLQKGYEIHRPTVDLITSINNKTKTKESESQKVYFMRGLTLPDVDKLRAEGYHGGRDLINGIDKGLARIVHMINTKKPRDLIINAIESWVAMVKWECRTFVPMANCMLWLPDKITIPLDMLQEACGESLVVIDRIEDLP